MKNEVSTLCSYPQTFGANWLGLEENSSTTVCLYL